ncbi:hypothetical protein [Methylobacterium mesophilicum]|uniref:hypothetical protein n=1 Tax=Methylobacterium mesophilicum TaxID=39956 RepID=UPI001EE18F02|nr:hypothetical protein [Methylobacterium mesophilicum]
MDTIWPFDEVRFRRLLKRATAKPTADPGDAEQRDRAMRAARAMASRSGIQFEDAAAELDARPIPVRTYVPDAARIAAEPALAPVETVEPVQSPTELDALRERVAQLEAQMEALITERPVSRNPSRLENGQATGSRQAKHARVIEILADPANQEMSLRALAKLAGVSPETIRKVRADRG